MANGEERQASTRLPLPVYEQLHRAAKRSHRSISAELRLAVERHLEREANAEKVAA